LHLVSSHLRLVVARGKESGASVRLEGEAKIVGRAREADLVLVDRRVSRNHLRVRAEGEGALVEVVDDASPIILGGKPVRQARLAPGDTIVVGETALVLLRAADSEAHSTEVSALMTGMAADVRGLAAAMELVEGLDAAEDETATRAALATWGARHLQALETELLVGDRAAELAGGAAGEGAPARVLEKAGSAPATIVLAAPAAGGEAAWVAFTVAEPPRGVTDTTRRLVAIASRLSASSLARIRSLRESREERELLRRTAIGSAHSFLGDSDAAREVARLAGRLATSDAVVLLEGETGVGKTFVARLLHESGARAKLPLRILNCAAIPETLVESELFGHERGAFTGATSAKAGALEAAGGGTVLLDEIGELPLSSQAKLLRVLEDKRFERLGSNRAVRLEARVIAATNRDLDEMVKEGTFRADLFYRIAVVKLRIPPLRERAADLPLLAERLLADLAVSAGRRVVGFAPDAVEAIRRHAWPGNVRELRNAIERALAIGEGSLIRAADLPETVHGAPPPQPTDESLVRLPAKLEWLEARAIEAALRSTGGNQRQAAILLGINRVTLHRKLKE
jgi:DNA-binding NtrC family response regulator/pSer/pThr/pTyr-binding forkhead associated (FHA) protein